MLKYFLSLSLSIFLVRYKLVQKHDEKQIEAEELSFPKYYVWDHVGVALHVDEHVRSFFSDSHIYFLVFAAN